MLQMGQMDKKSLSKILDEFRKLDPDNLAVDILDLERQVSAGTRLDVHKFEELFSHKKILIAEEGLSTAMEKLLASLGFEKEAADFVVSEVEVLAEMRVRIKAQAIFQAMTDLSESSASQPSVYSDEERMRTLRSLNTLYDAKPSFMDTHYKIENEKTMAEIALDRTQSAKLMAKERCFEKLSDAFEPIYRDFTYDEAKEYFKVTKAKGNFAAFLSLLVTQRFLENEGCLEYFAK